MGALLGFDEIFITPMKEFRYCCRRIKKVIFNNPATIIIWDNGEKTVVKCQEGDTFDEEKGFLLAVCKYHFGNTGKFNDVIDEWIER